MTDMPETVEKNFGHLVKGKIDPTGNTFVDDSDIIKPNGHAFEDPATSSGSLGLFR